MVRVRKVPGLEGLALAAYRQLVVDLAGKVEEAVRGKQMGLGMEQEVMRRVVMFVKEVQDFVWPTVVCYLTQQVAQETLDGVIEALERKKKTWTMETNMAEFRLQVTAMMKMTDLMHLPGLRFLDLEQVPKMMRPGVLRSLKNFRDLWRINMGFSAGGRQGSLLSQAVCEGVAQMHLLTHFSLQYACTDHLLSVLAPAAPNLKVLNIQHSGLVTDASLEPLLKLQHLHNLSMAKTFLSTESMARLVMQPNIVDLPACGYLTDVLDFILQDTFLHSAGAMPKGWRHRLKSWEEKQRVKLGVRQFHWDDTYYFHSTEQMKVVSQMCPNIQELHFMYENRYTCQPEIFHQWKAVTYLDWYGGDWHGDSLDLLVEALGPRLTKLQLHYVENFDLAAVATVAHCCQGLKCLDVAALVGSRYVGEGYEEEPYIAQIRRMEEAELRKTLVPLLDLEEVVVGGPCSSKELVTLLSLGLNLRKIRLGASCQPTDSTISEVLEVNQLQRLEAFEARDARQLTLASATLLINSCPDLVSLLDLATWGGVQEGELSVLKERVERENIELDLGEEMHTGEREITIYQLCRNALRVKYGRVDHWEGEE